MPDEPVECRKLLAAHGDDENYEHPNGSPAENMFACGQATLPLGFGERERPAAKKQMAPHSQG